MHLLAITPIHVSAEELARRQARYDRLAPAGVTVHLEDLGDGPEVPRSLETAEDIEASEAALLDRFRTADTRGVDAFLPDCVLDPVVDNAAALPRPVHGIARLSAHFLAGLGGRLGAVARNKAIAAELDRRLSSYGVAAEPTSILDLSVEDIADDAAWAAAVEHTLRGSAVDHVINACSAVDVGEPAGGPQLFDPTWTALQLIGLRATAGGGA